MVRGSTLFVWYRVVVFSLLMVLPKALHAQGGIVGGELVPLGAKATNVKVEAVDLSVTAETNGVVFTNTITLNNPGKPTMLELAYVFPVEKAGSPLPPVIDFRWTYNNAPVESAFNSTLNIVNPVYGAENAGYVAKLSVPDGRSEIVVTYSADYWVDADATICDAPLSISHLLTTGAHWNQQVVSRVSVSIASSQPRPVVIVGLADATMKLARGSVVFPPGGCANDGGKMIWAMAEPTTFSATQVSTDSQFDAAVFSARTLIDPSSYEGSADNAVTYLNTLPKLPNDVVNSLKVARQAMLTTYEEGTDPRRDPILRILETKR